ncbi:MAG: glycoside hydrolase family 3 C-terminal domain-containing protein, partial [Bacilli bacterium]|nr:glycoside hydrolase family 3 C-terminal domain-containing protein [Bacilli bacterium]
MKNRFLKLSALVVAALLVVVSTICLSLGSKALLLDRNGKYYADFDTKAEALEYADELNIELSAEGNVLLKNNGLLPLAKGSKVSVFGRAQNSLIGGTAGMGGGATVGGTGTIGGVLYDSGFQINPTVDQLYASNNGGIGVEKDITPAKDSFFWYNDAAFIVLSRTGGEGKDLDLVTDELAVLENAAPLVVDQNYDLPSGTVIEYNGEYYYTTSAFKTDVASTKDDVKAAATLITPTAIAVGDKKVNIASGIVVSNGGFNYELAAALKTADVASIDTFLATSSNYTRLNPTELVIGRRTNSAIAAGSLVSYNGSLYYLKNQIGRRTTLNATNIANAIGDNPALTVIPLVIGDEAAEYAVDSIVSYNGNYYQLKVAFNFTPDTVGLTADQIAAACTDTTKITPVEVVLGVEKNYAKGEYCLVDAAIYKFNNAFRLIGTTRGITAEQIANLAKNGTKAYADSFEHATLGKQGSRKNWNLSNAMGGFNGQTGSIDKLSEGPDVKHYLQLTNSEKTLIENVKANFKNIVVVLNTSNAMEVGDLQDDPAISAIVWIGRPGSTGLKAFGKIINGEVNTSGRLADEWFRDFTSDPVWQNYAKNIQVGSAHLYVYDYTSDEAKAHSVPTPQISSGTVAGEGFYGIDYDEDIYLGYGYAETVFAEIKAGNITNDPATGNSIEGSTPA